MTTLVGSGVAPAEPLGSPPVARGRRLAWWAGLRRRWGSSLGVRVTLTTFVLSAAIVGVLGVFLLDQVGRGLVQAKERSALAEAAAGLSYAQAQLTQSDGATPGGESALLQQIAFSLDGASNQTHVYDVGLLPESPTQVAFSVGDFRSSDVPAPLRRVVARRSVLALAYSSAPAPGGTIPTLVVGAPLYPPTGSPYELFFVFPLTAEVASVHLVRGILLIGGIVLVGLLVGIVALVTRQVVRPVRSVAEAAERLAGGRLEERLEVHGTDELARLAGSFNRMAGALQEQITRLERLSRVQRRFTADVSHELRTPLTTVRMAADLLHAGRAAFDPEVARSSELLHAELERFESLLTDLLEISRHDAGAAVLEPEQADLVALVRSCVAEAVPLARRRGSELVLRGGDAGGIVVEVDPRRVRRILRNLLGNAIEHGEGRPIEVRLAADEAVVAVRVRDRGVGLHPGESSLVFARFWRADRSRTRRTGGSGLGLAIALEDARLHGGWLQAWGEPDCGAAFLLVLPRRAGASVPGSPLALMPDDEPADPPVADLAQPAPTPAPAPEPDPAPPADSARPLAVVPRDDR